MATGWAVYADFWLQGVWVPPAPPPAPTVAGSPGTLTRPVAVTSYAGPLVIACGSYTFSKSYPAGGEPFALSFAHSSEAAIRFTPSAGYVFEYKAGRVKAYRSSGAGNALTEPTGVDLSTVSTTFIVWSR